MYYYGKFADMIKKGVGMLKIKSIVLGCFLSMISLNLCWGSRPVKKEPTAEELESKRQGLTKTLEKALAEEAVRTQLKESADEVTRRIIQGSKSLIEDELKRAFDSMHGDLVTRLRDIIIRSGNQYERNAIDKKYHIDEHFIGVVESHVTKIISEKHAALQKGRSMPIQNKVQAHIASTLKSHLGRNVVPVACDYMMEFGGSGYKAGKKIVEVLKSAWLNRFKEEHKEHYKSEIVRRLMAGYSSADLLTFNLSEAFQGIITNINECHRELETFTLVHDPNTDTIFKFRRAGERDRSTEIIDTFIQELQRQHDNSLFVIRYAGRVRGSTGWILPDRAHNFHEILDLYVLKYGQLGLFWKWSEHGCLDPKLCLRATAVSESSSGVTDNVLLQYTFGMDNVCYHRLVVPAVSIHGHRPPYREGINGLIALSTLHQLTETGLTFSWVFNREAIKTLWEHTIADRGATDFWASFPVVPGFNLQRRLGPLLFGSTSYIVPYVPTFLQYVQKGGEEIFVLENINRACSINNAMPQENTALISAQCP